MKDRQLVIRAEGCRGEDLQPGDLFSLKGPAYWNAAANGIWVDEHAMLAIGETVMLRTAAPINAHDAQTKVFRLTIILADPVNDAHLMMKGH